MAISFFSVLEDVMAKLMSEAQAQLEPTTQGQLLQIHTHLAQKQQLQQHVEPQPMEEQQFLYKTTSGTFVWDTEFLLRIQNNTSLIFQLITFKPIYFSLSSSGGMINAAEVSNYSGSGSGLPLLIQRSVARQISLINVIGMN